MPNISGFSVNFRLYCSSLNQYLIEKDLTPKYVSQCVCLIIHIHNEYFQNYLDLLSSYKSVEYYVCLILLIYLFQNISSYFLAAYSLLVKDHSIEWLIKPI